MRRAWCATALVAAIAMAVLSLAPALGAEQDGDKVKIKRNQEYDPVIDPADFVDEIGDPLPIDNQYLPLIPGTSFLYQGETEDGTEEILVYVTYETKEILGVTCTVVRETAWLDGELAEDTFDWHAQDRYGNIWYFGEYTEEYEDGEVSTEGSWEAGVDGAKPGILMLADPGPGDSYRQEYYEDVAEDMATVLRLNAQVSVAYSDFDNCLRTKEWTPLEPGSVEFKHYAPGLGLVLVTELKGGIVEIELVDIATD